MKLTCPLCGGQMSERKIDYEFRKKDKYIVVKNVPAFVCVECGEQYFEPEVVEKILNSDIEKEGRRVTCLEEVEVNYAAL
ncbi:hypothetical protein Thein_1961 [Thermodesulfatator indicus DSM 15286]|uniref:Zinc finger, YgiT-type n=2 Tax=Thermodesulfatator indicus TaxID=171695 RepID=F8A9R6_THEID|nr:type II toxin-antitoxin system MqsA family antitoxin [Thermodesulfatator indicus]AEH45815.1 hypothetical protein Thein_1961 [Thermodesulfatator indicus DSM 15286]